MKYFLLLTALSCCMLSCGQAKENAQEPQVRSRQEIPTFAQCAFIDSPTFLINDNFIIYEDCNTRTYLDADVKSFRLPKYYNNFAFDKNGVYVKGKFVQTDTTGFTYLGGREILLWKTATKVYNDTTEVIGADVLSFKPVESSILYFKDKSALYYLGEKIEGSDGATATSASYDNFCYDRNNAYTDGKIMYHNGNHLLPVNNILVKTKTTVYIREGMKPLTGADAATIRKLGNGYAIDKNHVYYGSTPLPILPKDFKEVKVWEQVNSAYASDGKTLYYRDFETVKGIDAASFGLVPFTDIFFDKTAVYDRYYNKTTELIEYHKLPFNYNTPINTTTVTRGQRSPYITYGSQAYDISAEEVYSSLTAGQVALINAGKLKLTKTLSGYAERITYENKLYKSGTTIYWDGKNTGADAATFVQVGYYFKDKDYVYSYSREKGLIALNGIDAATAVSFNGFLRDKKYIYSGNTKVISANGIALLAVFAGYRAGCGFDETPGSNFYLFKNDDGYWLVQISNKVTISSLGNTPGSDWDPKLKALELK